MSEETLEEWARSFGGTAILGLICALLIAGKCTHFILQRRGLVCGYLVVPPALISGLIGLLCLLGLQRVDAVMADDLRAGIESLRCNLVNFVFAAFVLGLMCTKANSLHTSSFRAMAVSILHEGMPMMIYSQILLWGQTTACLCVYVLIYGDQDPLYPTMITLGAEAGVDVAKSAGYSGHWLAIAIEAESMALVAISVIGVALISLRPYLLTTGWLGAHYLRESKERVSAIPKDGKAEAFDRRPVIHRSFSHETIDEDHESDTSIDRASLGTHLSLISLAVFFSFAFFLLLHIFENTLSIKNHLLSGARLFKVSMCFAALLMVGLTRRTNLRFRRDWFMRLCGLMMDLLVIAAMTKAYPQQHLNRTQFMLVFLFVSICIIWNLLCFWFLAKELFPNFWYERALTLSGDSLGRAYTGLLFARTLDPAMESPVPVAYAAKLMLFFVPTTGAKTTIVAMVTQQHGAFYALVICALILATWAAIFQSYFHSRFVRNERSDKDKGGKVEATEPAENQSLLTEADASYPSLNNRGSGKMSRTGLAIITDDEVDEGYEMQPTFRFSQQSSILSLEQMTSLVHLLPEAKQTKDWQLAYGLRTHGACLQTLLATCIRHTSTGAVSQLPCVLLIEDSWGYVFGGYISPTLQDKKTYYGNGESFVFTVLPTLTAYHWTGKNNLFAISHEGCLGLGGGGDGYAIQIDDELDTGVSCRSETFDNPTLSSNEFFKCLNVEVWLLDNIGYSV